MRTTTFLCSVVAVMLCVAGGCATSDPAPDARNADVVEVYGELAGVSTDAPPTWPCAQDAGAKGCPRAEPVGQLTVDGQVFAITSDPEVYGCGPNDGRERRPTSVLFDGLDRVDTAWVQAAGVGPTLHALRVHVGVCG